MQITGKKGKARESLTRPDDDELETFRRGHFPTGKFPYKQHAITALIFLAAFTAASGAHRWACSVAGAEGLELTDFSLLPSFLPLHRLSLIQDQRKRILRRGCMQKKKKKNLNGLIFTIGNENGCSGFKRLSLIIDDWFHNGELKRTREELKI